MRVLSLFDGMSCGQLALKRLGYSPEYYASEIDARAIATTLRSFPKTVQLGDVTKLSAADVGPVDLLLAGSPCQGFSAIGQKLNFDDPRSKLFFEFVRLKNELIKLNPKMLWLLENVAMKQEWAKTIDHHTGAVGVKLCSRYFSAQRRVRVYWTNAAIDWHKVKAAGIAQSVADIMQSDDELTPNCRWVSHKACPQYLEAYEKYCYDYRASVLRPILKQTNCILTAPLSQPGYRGVIRSLAPMAWYDSAKQLGNLMLRPECFKSGYVQTRRFTSVELERCQGLPDNYTVGTYEDRHHQIGNGWCVPVVVEILREALR